MRELRFISYLAPSLPEALFEWVAAQIGAALGLRASVRLDSRTSGPRPGEPDPFSTREADLGFLCAPSYLWLAETRQPLVRLIAAPVFRDPRAGGLPVYFSDVVVRHAHPARSFEDLRGGTWAFNDPCSLSGFLSLMQRVRKLGSPFFQELVQSGSHLASMRAVIEGEVDAAAIDSNVLAIASSRDPGLRASLRVIDTWGPYPVQPIVARSSLPEELCRRVTAALAALHQRASLKHELEALGVARFAPVTEADYAFERAAMADCELDSRRLGASHDVPRRRLAS